ncbi:MAG: energy-coupling factor transporter ATPase [Clostridia bacterium]|nr:energy-coupling factor transporter ATPase [Clostridia bacterium]
MLLKLENVGYTYQAGSPFQSSALKGIDLEIRSGESIALIGHTGSGKSTLVQHFNGLLKPTEGRILLDGEDICQNDYDLKSLRRRVGLVFQYPETQLFEETVRKDIAFGPHNLGLDEAEIERRVDRAMRLVGLDPNKDGDMSPFELSGGKMRRCAIAGVIAMEPEMLVLDEPAAGLDPKGRHALMSLIDDLHQKGTTIVMISHSMEDAARYATRVIALDHGRIVRDGTPEAVFADAEGLLNMGLDVPDVCALGIKLRKNGLDFPETVIRPQEALNALIALLGGEKHA